jgi:hypothetical protein
MKQIAILHVQLVIENQMMTIVTHVKHAKMDIILKRTQIIAIMKSKSIIISMKKRKFFLHVTKIA